MFLVDSCICNRALGELVPMPTVPENEELPDPVTVVAVMVPAEKFPLESRDTMALAVLALVAVVAELLTFPAVAMVASLVSAIAADASMSALTIAETEAPPARLFSLAGVTVSLLTNVYPVVTVAMG